jgi:hypothetical protein
MRRFVRRLISSPAADFVTRFMGHASGCMLLPIFIGGPLLLWWASASTLWRRGHFVLAVLTTLVWPLVFNLLFGTSIVVAGSVQRWWRRVRGFCWVCGNTAEVDANGRCDDCEWHRQHLPPEPDEP